MVDSATGLTEQYVWNADGTLASYPGSGYTRRLAYNEEGQLTQISRDYGGGNVQAAYQYGYGADGGRRWRKDLANNVWTWYPCGVACCAGQLVEMQSDLTGSSWSVSAQYLRGLEMVRRNAEYQHSDLQGSIGIITTSSGTTSASLLSDAFLKQQYTQGSVQSMWRSELISAADESLILESDSFFMPERHTWLASDQQRQPRQSPQGGKPKPVNPDPVVKLASCDPVQQVYCVGYCNGRGNALYHHEIGVKGCYVLITKSGKRKSSIPICVCDDPIQKVKPAPPIIS